MGNLEDQKLIKGTANGDMKAFELLMLKYEDLVYGVSLKLVRDKTKAEDLTQETWMKVIQQAPKYSPFGSVKSWILQLNRNLIMDYFREQKKWRYSEDIDEIELLDDSADFSMVLESDEKYKSFTTVFADLDEREKLVLTMVIVEELSYSEIAQKIGLSVGAVKTIVFRAKNTMKGKLVLKREET